MIAKNLLIDKTGQIPENIKSNFMSILRKIYTLISDLIESVVITGAIVVSIYFFLFRPFQVSGNSMFPNFKNGEYTLTKVNFLMKFTPLKRGDVIVFKSPANDEKDFIKRVIGLPKDKISIQNGYVFVNNQRLDESIYLPPDFKTYPQKFLQEGEEIEVPENSYFVLGDNRSFSSDSRDWGFVAQEKIIGKSFYVYWPLSKTRTIQSVNYNL